MLDADGWSTIPYATASPQTQAESDEFLAELFDSIATELTPRQRGVLLALAVDGVPIDVLAERLSTTRGALYKILHDARRKLRTHLSKRGVAPYRDEPGAYAPARSALEAAGTLRPAAES